MPSAVLGDNLSAAGQEKRDLQWWDRHGLRGTLDSEKSWL